MQFIRNSLFARSDTIFGVCQALGQDFGISPNWFRVAFASAVVFNLEYAVIAYAAVGALVLVSRIVMPGRAVEEAPAVFTAAPAEAAKVEAAKVEAPVEAKLPAQAPAMAQAA